MSSSEDARHEPPAIVLACHTDRTHNYVTCILCKSDFVRKHCKGNGFLITNSLMVCQEHSITYKGNHVCNIDSDDFDNIECLNLKIELLKQELLNLKEMDTKEDVNNDEELSEQENESNSKKNRCVVSFRLLRSEVRNLKKLHSELKKNTIVN